MAKKLGVKKISQKSLTLDDLVKYNQEVLFPALDDKFAKIDGKFAKIDNHFEKIEEEIREKFDKVLNGQDKILKTIEDLRSDNIASTQLYKKQERKLENHEIRIKIIEKKVGIAEVK